MSEIQQIKLTNQLINHFYVGIIITAFYAWLSPTVIGLGFPGLSVLLIAEVFILVPLVCGHLMLQAKKFSNSFKMIIPLQKKLTTKSFLIWTVVGILVSLIVYIPLYPVGLYLRESVFAWLPEWYFNPTYGTDNLELIARMFLAGIFIDGLLGPIAEELFFRGYLLPRMAYLKKWAPVVNGALFGLYHFWQPHNLIALICLGVVFSYIVWKTRNVYVGIAIHCVLNILGSIGGYLATMDGVFVGR